ncbi:MAG: rasP, partial [Sedimentibacter sp.]|nr:rasP [Sedimentibacter sp.]
MLTLIASILVFSAIVLVHEFGHYKAAKSVGIKVYEFAIGMGPTVLKREK